VDREQSNPRDVRFICCFGDADILQAMSQDLVKCKLAGLHLCEAGFSEVKSQADLIPIAVEPVRPVVVDCYVLDYYGESNGDTGHTTYQWL